jgi:hypothetical protein
MTDTTNINGHRQQIAAQLTSVVAFVAQDNFNMLIPDAGGRFLYHERIRILTELLQNIDDTLDDPASVPQELP